MNTPREYIPGVCNIGPEEIARRWKGGWIGLGATVLLWILFITFHVSPSWRVLLFFPAMTSAVGFLQAISHFCVAFGAMGVFNFKAEVGKTDTVTQADFRAKDKTKAMRIIAGAIGIGLVVAALGYFVRV